MVSNLEANAGGWCDPANRLLKKRLSHWSGSNHTFP